MYKSLRRLQQHNPVAFLMGVGLLAWAVLCQVVHAAPAGSPVRDEGLQVEVVGQGRPVLMIPGLNSGAETWRETCQALRHDETVQCHLIQLPGFAGTPPIADIAFLDDMTDRLLAYVQRHQLQHPVVVGHSLGGVLALKMALAAPGRLGPLVITDALPFLPAAGNPAASVDSARPLAEDLRRQMREASPARYQAQAEAAVAGMAHDPARVALLRQWGAASDRATSIAAMYDLMTQDLRPRLGAIHQPVLVLGSWAGYQPFGATLASTRAIFAAQYAALPDVRIEMSQAGYHFLMWDDPQWLQSQVRAFIDAAPAG